MRLPYGFAISLHILPEVCIFVCPFEIRGHGEDPVGKPDTAAENDISMKGEAPGATCRSTVDRRD